MDSKIYYRTEKYPLDYYLITLYYNNLNNEIGYFIAAKGENLLLNIEDYLFSNNIDIDFNELIPIN